MIGIMKFPLSLDHLQPSTKAPPTLSSLILGVPVLPKSWALFSGSKLKHRDSVLGEVEKSSFYCFSRQKRPQESSALKTVPSLGKNRKGSQSSGGEGSATDKKQGRCKLALFLPVGKPLRGQSRGQEVLGGFRQSLRVSHLDFLSGIKNTHKRRECQGVLPQRSKHQVHCRALIRK